MGETGGVSCGMALNLDIPDEVVSALANPNSYVVVSTGAGVSAESGVPTFRSAGGYWKTYRAESLATPEAFSQHPHVVWEWYEYRRGLVRKVEPNPGHYELARWEKHFSRFSLITQNVDGLHRRAGSSQPIELHGNIMLTRCHECGEFGDVAAPGEGDEIPQCSCGGLYRPAVVWFGEMLPRAALDAAWAAAAQADVYLSVGTSGVVQPAASLVQIARQNGAYVIEVNPEPTGVSHVCDACVRLPSGVALPAIGRRIGVPE